MRQLRLIGNMRAHNDRWFIDYPLRLGNGTNETSEEGNFWLLCGFQRKWLPILGS
jgi:hypothetical protein